MDKVGKTRIGALSNGALKGLNYFVILLAQASNPSLIHITFSTFGFIINTEYGGSMSSHCVSKHLPGYTVSHPRIQYLHIHCHKNVQSHVFVFNFGK
jgi:hypothetical protein